MQKDCLIVWKAFQSDGNCVVDYYTGPHLESNLSMDIERELKIIRQYNLNVVRVSIDIALPTT